MVTMPRGEELSEFEKQRAANIAERDALLKKLTSEAQSSGIFPKLPSSNSPKPGSQPSKKKTQANKVKKENEPPVPRRTSSRLRGLTADSEVAKRKAEEEYEAAKTAETAKRARVAGDLDMGDIVVNGQKWDASGLLGLGGGSQRYVRSFGEDDIKNTKDKDLKSLREKLSGLQLWEPWEPNRMSGQ